MKSKIWNNIGIIIIGISVFLLEILLFIIIFSMSDRTSVEYDARLKNLPLERQTIIIQEERIEHER